MRFQRKLGAFASAGLLILLFVYTLSQNAAPTDKIVVAVFQGEGANDYESLELMFRRLNCTVTVVYAQQINDGRLDGFNVLCFPGGDMYVYSQEFTSTGMENMRDFVRNGGAYFGVCGGAYFSSERVVWQGHQLDMTPLGLFPGTALGPIEEISPVWTPTDATVNIVRPTHPTTQNEPSSRKMYYNSGPMFLPNEDANVTVLGRYDIGNQPVIVAFEYGKGRAFIIGTHPEASSRSTWGLIGNAVSWLTENQTSN